MSQLNCQDGVCEVPESQKAFTSLKVHTGKRVIYVGDPMCSWCYGISSVITGLQTYCDEQEIAFEMIVGGLRSGGGDQWNESFKDFLRNEWQKIEKTTGQPFAFKILDLPFFDYDTEPSCRAVVVARELLPEDNQKSLTQFLGQIQTKFYLENQDPKETDFYQSICEAFGISYAIFKERFESAEAKQQTIKDFRFCRELGVRGFPSFLLIQDQEVSLLTAGYTSLQSLIRKIEKREKR